MRKARCIAFALAFGGALLVALPSRAEDDRAAYAERLFQRGVELMKNDDCPDAIPHFLNSQELDPSAAALMNLATCYARLGRNGTAWKTYRRAAAAAATEHNAELRDQAFKGMSTLSPSLTKLRLVPASADAGVSLRVNGEPVTNYDGMPIPLDPGENIIEALAPGREPWRRSVTATDSGATIVIEVPELRSQEKTERGTGLRAPALIVGGAGIASLVAGSILGLSAKSTYDDSTAHCVRNHCTTRGIELRDSASDKATASTIAFALGGLATAAGVTLWFWPASSSSREQAEREAPIVKVRSQGLGLAIEASH
jgi:hypothetical protein